GGPGRAAQGGRTEGRVVGGRRRAGARGRQGGWAPAVDQAVPEPQSPRAAPAALTARPPSWPCSAARAGGLLAPARAGPPRVWAPPGPPWQGLRQTGSVGRAGRPQAWAPASAGW